GLCRPFHDRSAARRLVRFGSATLRLREQGVLYRTLFLGYLQHTRAQRKEGKRELTTKGESVRGIGRRERAVSGGGLMGTAVV
ncbi:MAG: hypothetical protein ACO1RA_01945, partial [Planctomycetaceae bacterium]